MGLGSPPNGHNGRVVGGTLEFSGLAIDRTPGQLRPKRIAEENVINSET